jgi:hypothetical protein
MSGKFSAILLLFVIIVLFPARGECQFTPVVNVPELQEEGSYDSMMLPGFTHDPAYRELLREGLALQQRIESLSSLAASCRSEAGGLENKYENYQLQKKTVLLEDSIKRLNMLADSIFSLVSALENSSLSESDERPYLLLHDVKNGIKVYAYNLAKMTGYVPAEGSAGSLAEDNETRMQVAEAGQFEIFPMSPYSSEHPADSLFKIPAGVFYRIQLAAFSRPVSNDHFGGIWPVTMARVPGKGLVKYYGGRFCRYEDARRALGQVKGYGFADAFIVAYFNSQVTSLTRARQYEILQEGEN